MIAALVAAARRFRRSQAQPSAPARPILSLGYDAPIHPIDVEVAPDTLERLFARTQAQWQALGENEPYYSVLTGDQFRMSNLTAEAEAEFFATGGGNAALLEQFEARAGVRLQRGACLELGCGVGRITRHLADRFDKVIAVDISAGNLAICERHLARCGITNVETRLISQVSDLERLPSYDVLFSLIVLQHNNPPVQNAMLGMLLPKINPGGGCFFQTCTNLFDYRFQVESYLASPEVEMEVHCLPQRYVLGAMRSAGLDVQEVVTDNWVAAYGSNTFFATKPAARL